MKEGCLGG
uniref:Uncharacterized protein n=1 Tax=Lotus japonicus TaxID=34305 RepID=I3SRU2_LOTJA|nr:unknown [Lotus japonicus]